ncbi:phosphatidate cytidylyltransferase [Vibrio profundum]|uniref:phosphatidate cytidylyltransferase n=1 Tax=Vibrio profundum TaxID=2910247 RepID=UPI003D0A73A3
MMASEWFIVTLMLLITLGTLMTRRSHSVSRDFYLRVRSWWWMILLLTVVTFSGENARQVLLLFIGWVSVYEISVVSKLKRRVQGAGHAVVLMLVFIEHYFANPIVLTVAAIGISLIVFFYGFRRPCDIASQRAFNIFIALLIMITACLSLRYYRDPDTVFGLMLYLIFVTQSCDVCQYFCGKAFGKRKLAPNLSPNKTLEGAVGGALIAALLATGVSQLITPLPLLSALWLSLVLVSLGIAGDLYVSWFKRRSGVKDMGRLIPGHGGMMDRVDSLLFSAPMLAVIAAYLIPV